MKMNQESNYFIYARKSSESEDRQVASIPAQLEELKKLATQHNLSIVDIFIEEKSAKEPGRPIFNEMLAKIHQGEAQGIICWKLDRLARNPVDGGNINWMLQQGVIQHIQTYQRSYYPTDNVIMMNVEFGMANQYVIDLSVNVKRGMRKKVSDGWFPHVPPLGYLNNRYNLPEHPPIYPDPERFYQLKALWQELLETRCSLDGLRKKAIDLGLKSKKGNELPRGYFYNIFKNPFYYGSFIWNDEVYQGNHQPIITKQEFDLAQEIIAGKYKSCPKYKTFKYTGLIRCGECGSAITAETKTKKQRNGNIHHYTYYRCTKRKKSDVKCQQKTIREESLEDQFSNILDNITIPPEFQQWAIKAMREDQASEKEDRERILSMQQEQLGLAERKLETILSMRLNGELTPEEYSDKKKLLKNEKQHIEELIQDTNHRFDTWLEKAEHLLSFAETARQQFEIGTLETKRKIIQTLGSNLYLADRTLTIELTEPLELIKGVSPEVCAVVKRLEPVKQVQKDAQKGLERVFNEKWRERWDSNPRPPA
jgi:site-specific DNA recombinase